MPWRTRPRTARKALDFDFAPFARLKTLEGPGTHRDADQPQDRESHGGGHAPYLAIAPFADRELDPARRDESPLANRRHSRPQPRRLVDEPGRGGSRRVIGQLHPAPQRLQRGFRYG